jgi:hypothetical protein
MQNTVIRGCSFFGQLLEILVDVKVERNQAPFFKGKPITRFVLHNNQTYNYKLP